MELKFRYIYGIPGKLDTYFARYFTIEEIEDGKPLLGEDPLNDIEIISRDQFTGLKDKNGKEIYENDLVSGWCCGYELENDLVFMDAGAFSVKADDDYWPCLFEDSPESNLEVIGNAWGIK